MKRIALILVLIVSLCLAFSFAGCAKKSSHGGGGSDDDTASDDDADDDSDDDSGPFNCNDLDLPVKDFQDVESSTALYATAADFTLPTTDGDWNFKTQWTGCETYLIIQDVPNQETGWTPGLFDRDVATFFQALPDNTQVFFESVDPSEDNRNAALDKVKKQADAYIGSRSEEEQALWKRRIHYVTDQAWRAGGWLGKVMQNPGWGVGIDRFQRIRYIGSYADYLRFDSSKQWFAPNLKMAANEAVYYNFEASRQQSMDAEDARVLQVFNGQQISDPGWTGEMAYADVEFPSAAIMGDIDSMELDLYLGCVGDGEYGDCPAWDYIANLYLCDQNDPPVCDTEMGRWITTYHREGRWVHDVSGLLPLLAQGGTRKLAFYTQQPYEVTLSVRLFTKAKKTPPTQSIYLFSGGYFDANYNTNHPPKTISIPAGVTRVELTTVLSGHGGASPGNCAEFCDVEHHFIVNGHDNVRDFPDAGNYNGCMQMVNQGTVPNQYGTWWYGRGGWCPGKEVPMVITDITSQVTPGADNTFEYNAFYDGQPYPGSGANIDLTSWLVLYK